MPSKKSLDAIVDAAWRALDEGLVEDALDLAADALEIDAHDADAHAILGAARFELLEIEEARAHLASALALRADHPDAHYWMALVFEREGNETQAARHLREAARGDPERYPKPFRLDEKAFQREVEAALEKLPREFRDELTNLAIVVEPIPDANLLQGDPPLPPTILGLHVGTPRPQRANAPGAGPNTIFLFQRNIERAATTREELLEQIEVTLLHEIGHYLGLDEDDVGSRGLE